MADLPLSSSFLVDVEEAVLAEILSELGEDSTTYPTPEYLWLAFADRGEVVPRLEINEAKLPGLLMQYVSGSRREGGIGLQMNREEWNIGAVLLLTPEILGYDGDDYSTFLKYAQASADTLARRLRKTLLEFKPSVADATFGEISGKPWIDRWTLVAHRRGDREIVYEILLEYGLATELRR